MQPAERRITESLLAGLQTHPVTPSIADLAGDFLREYRARGITLDLVDTTIAATAVTHSLTLVTLNTRHYPMPELVLLPVSESW